MEFAKDPLTNAVYQGIKRGIQVTYDSDCFGSCLILIYSGIDAMSYLSMPVSQNEAHRKDFIKWSNKYLSPVLTNETTAITGEELYSARCGVVHTYTVESKKTKQGSARMIGYLVGGGQPIVYDPKVAKDLVLLRLDVLRDAFFVGIDKFLVEAYAEKPKQAELDRRVKKLLSAIPYSKKK